MLWKVSIYFSIYAAIRIQLVKLLKSSKMTMLNGRILEKFRHHQLLIALTLLL